METETETERGTEGLRGRAEHTKTVERSREKRDVYMHYIHIHALYTYTTYMYIHNIHTPYTYTCTTYIHYIHIHTQHTCTIYVYMHYIGYIHYAPYHGVVVAVERSKDGFGQAAAFFPSYMSKDLLVPL